MSAQLVKTNYPGYVKDTRTGAILNTNEDEWELFKQQRSRAAEITSLQQDVASLKTDIADIKSLLVQIIANRVN